MISIKEVDGTEKVAFKFEPLKVYELSNENGTLGYGTINKDDENLLTVFIKEDFRGNGFGTEMFHFLLRNAKDSGYEDVNLKVSVDNVPMIKIIEGANGFNCGKNGYVASYVVHLSSPIQGVFDCE